MKTKISMILIIGLIVLAGLIGLPAFGGNDSSSSNQTPFSMAPPDLYWLSYIENGKGVFLMQIDSTGKVTRTPVFMGKFGPAISSNGPNTINLWGPERVVINKKTLSITKKIKNPIGRPNSITNKTLNNFATKRGQEPVSLRFFGVSPTGIPKGENWEISSGEKGFCHYVVCPPGAVSSDGRAVLWIVREFFNPTGMYIQLLSDTGRPDGFQKPVRADGSAAEAAISNVLPGERIYLVYVLLKNWLSPQLVLQTVDAQTGQKIGDKIVLKNAQFSHYSVAVDPLGRFVIYCSRNKQKEQFLSFLALDGTGHPSGTAKVLVRKVDAYDFYLLKD